MRAGTHLALAGLTGIVGAGFGAGPDLSGGMALALGSLLPDLDARRSTVGRVVPRLSSWLEQRFGHRTITHSLLGVFAIGTLFAPLLLIHRPSWSWLLIGYASHLLLDSANVSGVPIFWPARLQMWLVHNRAWRVPYGSARESVWFGVIVLSALLLAPISLHGFTPWFHRALGTPYGAVADYLRWKDGHEVWAQIRGTNLTTGERIDHRFRVVGALNSETLLLEDERGRAFSAGLGQRASITTEWVTVLPGDEIEVTTFQLDLTGASLGALEFDSGAGRAFLTGSLLLDEAPTLTHPAGQYARLEASGRRLELRAATSAELVELARYRVVAGSGVIRIEVPVGAVATPPRLTAEPTLEIVSMTVAALPTVEALEVARGSVLEVGTLLARYPADDRLLTARAELERTSAEQEALQQRYERERSDLDRDEVRLLERTGALDDRLASVRVLVAEGAEPAANLTRLEQERAELVRALNDLAATSSELELAWSLRFGAERADIERLRSEVARAAEQLLLRSPLAGTVSGLRIVGVSDGIDVELEIILGE